MNQETEPIIDVVIPVHNRSQYLDEAICSVLSQSGFQTHVFVIDDYSDFPVTLNADLLASEQLTLVRSTTHLGIGGARNLGARQGSADWLAFLDSDDVWRPDHCAALMNLMDDFLDFTSGATVHFADPSQGSEYFVPDDVQLGSCAGSTLFRRAAFYKIGGFRDQFKVGEFIDLMARGSAVGWKSRRTTDVVLERRVPDSHASRGASADDLGYLRVIRDHINRTRDSPRA